VPADPALVHSNALPLDKVVLVSDTFDAEIGVSRYRSERNAARYRFSMCRLQMRGLAPRSRRPFIPGCDEVALFVASTIPRSNRYRSHLLLLS
jgi:hypothetical protein